ncbi:MAG: mechanosensitive ion channel domain-containing protein [Candidatus Berkiella sp.]
MSEMFAAYSTKIMNSFLLALLFLAIYAGLYFVFLQRIQKEKRYNQAKIRLRYILITIFLVCFIKIWVQGFIQIVAFIGFISAAITITQKDNLLNLIGWLIINWRELFHEGDYIKIAQNAGVVKKIGVMYFTLQESSPDFPGYSTGRVIKIPNGLVARNPVVNFSHEVFTESTFSFIFKPTGSFDLIERLFLNLKDEIMQYLVQSYKTDVEKKEILDEFSPKHVIKIRQEKPAGYEFVLMFYSKYQDKSEILYQINKTILSFAQLHPDLVIAFD